MVPDSVLKENIGTHSSELSGFAICSFEKSGILVVPTTDNPYLASKVLSTPVKTISRCFLVFPGIVFLAIAMFCVLCTLIRMALAVNRITQSTTLHPSELASGIEYALLPIPFATWTALIGAILLVVGLAFRKRATLNSPVPSSYDNMMPNIDPDFESMKYNGFSAWDCRIDFQFPHSSSKYFAVHIWSSDETGPSDQQRETFRELKRRYESIWPAIASSIVAVHASITDSFDVAKVMRERVAVHIGELDETSIELVIELDLPDEGTKGYFIPIENGSVKNAIVAE